MCLALRIIGTVVMALYSLIAIAIMALVIWAATTDLD